MSDAAAPGWDQILDADEDLIWQGNPAPGLHAPGKTLFQSVFGLPFLGMGLAAFVFGLFAVFGLGDALGVSGGAFVTLFSLPFIAVGLRLVVLSWVMALTAHRHIHYSLSTKRAFVATDFWKRTLDSYPITPDSTLSLEDHGTTGTTGTVWFAVKVERGHKRRSIETRIGFEHIAEAAKVYRLMRDIQQRRSA
jgi:hypothetical protein